MTYHCPLYMYINFAERHQSAWTIFEWTPKHVQLYNIIIIGDYCTIIN